ncbi:Ig-like domain-containing protein, partial [Shewanella sp.]|nr:Ig-like domain-containing protein [Shewanella sp.]
MKSAYRAFFAFIWVLILTACGGGGSLSADTDSQAPEDVSGSGERLILTLMDKHGDEINSISQAQPGTITATYTNAANEGIADQVVTFTSSLGKLTPSSGTALTDTNGVASLSITAGDIKGADNITATVGELTQTIGFSTQGDEVIAQPIDAYALSLTIVDSSGVALRDIAYSTPGHVIATLTKNGQAAAFETISFNLS